jgi:hypothetical protein
MALDPLNGEAVGNDWRPAPAREAGLAAPGVSGGTSPPACHTVTDDEAGASHRLGLTHLSSRGRLERHWGRV